MEGSVLPDPAVAGVLSRNFIEARLHTDAHDEEKREVILAQQLELEEGIGLPYYIVMDPATRAELVEFDRADRALRDVNVFRDFLEEGIEASSDQVARQDR